MVPKGQVFYQQGMPYGQAGSHPAASLVPAGGQSSSGSRGPPAGQTSSQLPTHAIHPAHSPHSQSPHASHTRSSAHLSRTPHTAHVSHSQVHAQSAHSHTRSHSRPAAPVNVSTNLQPHTNPHLQPQVQRTNPNSTSTAHRQTQPLTAHAARSTHPTTYPYQYANQYAGGQYPTTSPRYPANQYSKYSKTNNPAYSPSKFASATTAGATSTSSASIAHGLSGNGTANVSSAHRKLNLTRPTGQGSNTAAQYHYQTQPEYRARYQSSQYTTASQVPADQTYQAPAAPSADGSTVAPHAGYDAGSGLSSNDQNTQKATSEAQAVPLHQHTQHVPQVSAGIMGDPQQREVQLQHQQQQLQLQQLQRQQMQLQQQQQFQLQQQQLQDHRQHQHHPEEQLRSRRTSSQGSRNHGTNPAKKSRLGLTNQQYTRKNWIVAEWHDRRVACMPDLAAFSGIEDAWKKLYVHHVADSVLPGKDKSDKFIQEMSKHTVLLRRKMDELTQRYYKSVADICAPAPLEDQVLLSQLACQSLEKEVSDLKTQRARLQQQQVQQHQAQTSTYAPSYVPRGQNVYSMGGLQQQQPLQQLGLQGMLHQHSYNQLQQQGRVWNPP